MTKLFLMQSKSEKNNSGDMILDISKAISFRIVNAGEYFVLGIDYSDDQKAVASFDKLSDAREVLRSMFNMLEQDVSLADKIDVLEPRNRSKSILEDILKEVLSK